MTKPIVTLIFVFAFINSCVSQQLVLDGNKYKRDGTELKTSDLKEIMGVDSEAYSYVRKAKGNKNLYTVLSFAGGFAVGFPIGTKLGGGEADWRIAGVGAVLLAVSIPFALKSSSNSKKAVDLYNASLDTSLLEKEAPEFSLEINDSGFGLLVRF